jgi:predicted sugar kinase
VEIEWAIPTLMGLGSDPLLGLTTAETLAHLHGLPTVSQDALGMARALGLGPEHALNLWGFQQGGLMLMDTAAANGAPVPALLRRHPLPHADRNRAWVFVVFMPRVSPEIPAAYEAERQQALWRAAPHIGPDSGRVFADQLWPAVEREDLPTFARALRALQRLTEAALAQAGTPNGVDESAQAILQVMQDNGALAWGQSLTGFALYGLVQGQEAARQLKLKILAHSGHFGGTELAAVADNSGVRCSGS